jgi:hypothetical protein
MWGGGQPFGYFLRGMPGTFDLEAHVAGDPNFGISYASHLWFNDTSARLLSIEFGCIWNDSTDGCGPTPGQTLRVNRVELDPRDAVPPEVTRVSTPAVWADGSAFADMVIETGDRGGGVSSTSLLVDGKPVVDPDALSVCEPPYVHPVPCPRTARFELMLPASEFGSGSHTYNVGVTDAAGNQSTSQGTFDIPAVPQQQQQAPSASVTGGSGVPPSTAPQSTPPGTIAAWFAQGHRTTVHARYGAPPTILGTVHDTTGHGIAWAPVQVSQRLLMAGATLTSLPPLASDQDGGFRLGLTSGPSRDVRLSYSTSTSASVAILRMIVPAPVRLRVDHQTTRNGRSVAFSGTVPGAPKRARARVELQAWAAHWIPFRAVTLKNGRFSARYRFTRTFQTTSYRFRAVIPGDPSFPYASGTSPVVRVLVRG